MTLDTPDFEFEYDAVALGAPSNETLADEALDAAMSKSVADRIRRGDGIAVVVQVPSADWVSPMLSAVRRLRTWTLVAEPDKTGRKRPDGATAAAILAGGRSVVGVSHAPERLLPAALVAAADIRIFVSTPENRVVRRVIRRATGERARGLPPKIASGLDFNDLVAAIRVGGTARDCVERLVAAARSLTVVDPNVAAAPPLEELHGYGAVHVWGTALVADLGEWRAGRLAFSAIDRNMVMASEPGLGKSSFVRSLARSTGLPLVATSVASWFSASDGYLHSVMKEIDGVFARAAAMAPAILFLDELDAVPDRRTLDGRNRDYWLPIVTQLLLLLDSATSGISSNLCVIGATNHGDRIDPALVRPGRLNRIIHIGPPDRDALVGVFRQHLGPDLPDADLGALATVAVGASGARVQEWVKAARAKARAAGRPLEHDDLSTAIAPPDRRLPDERRRIAIHEASHAVVAHLSWPGSVKVVSTVGRGDNAGSVGISMPSVVSQTRSQIEANVVMTLAGRAGEVAFCGEASTGAGGSRDSDLGLATSLVASMATSYGLAERLGVFSELEESMRRVAIDPELRRWVEVELARLFKESLLIVRANRASVEAVADALEAHRYLDGASFLAIMESAGSGSDWLRHTPNR